MEKSQKYIESKASLKERYFSKLVSKLVAFGLGFVTLGLVPRALGPVQYGNFSFLTFFFQKLDKFLNMGISTAFYTKLSKRQNEQKLIGFYLYFIGTLVLLVGIGITVIFLINLQDVVWPAQRKVFICAAALFALLTFFAAFIQQVNDAYGYTVKIELFYIVQSIISTGMILFLFFTKTLNITTYFLLHYTLLAFVILTGLYVLHSNKVYLLRNLRLTWKDVKDYIKEFYSYVHPLVTQALVVFLVAIGDRWLLQYFAGSAEQGYFGLAFRLGAMCFLFTSSMSPLLIREISLSYSKGDKARMRRLFVKFIPLFYFIASYFAVFIAFNSELLTNLIGGIEYKGAVLVIAVMVFYPIHQTYGQLSGSVFLATERTKIIRNISVGTGMAGMLLSFVLLAPAKFWGLGLGALGLAVKMVIVQLIAVNIQLFINSRYFNFSFLKFLGHQILVLALLLGFSLAANRLVAMVPLNDIGEFLLNGIVYTIFASVTILLFPRLISITRHELFFHLNAIFKKANLIHSKLF